MASAITRLMTAEEFYDWVHRPENHDRHFELEAGEVIEMPLPGERHGSVCARVAWVLVDYTQTIGRGHVCSNDTGLIFQRDPDTVRGADVALYLDERSYEELSLKYSDRLPTLAVEVLSPTDRMNRMVKRINQFLAKGVPLVWLLDPDARSVTVWRSQQPPVVLEADEALTGFEVLPDFLIAVEKFFVLSKDRQPRQ